jgi:hypothetical protein
VNDALGAEPLLADRNGMDGRGSEEPQVGPLDAPPTPLPGHECPDIDVVLESGSTGIQPMSVSSPGTLQCLPAA